MTTPDSFYVTGGTIPRDAPCYVTREADEALYRGLAAGEFCYVLTSRQMGKSSLMVRCAQRLREEGVAVLVFDLTSLGQNVSAEQWYTGLLLRLASQVDYEEELEDWWEAHLHLGPLARFFQALCGEVLPRCSGRVVVFVDEIDTVRSLPFSTDEFFAAIRECYNRRTEEPELARLTFCLLGVAGPSDLIRDTRLTPFNIGRRIELTDFTREEAAPLAVGIALGGPGTALRSDVLARLLLGRVLYWTGGHPYLTQRLSRAVCEDPSVKSGGDVDRKCRELFLEPRARERDDNLLFVRERLLRSEVDRATLLERYRQVWRAEWTRKMRRRSVQDNPGDPVVSALLLAGILRVERGRLRVRNRSYRRVFDERWAAEHMPDADLQRQRAAFCRGAARTATVSIVIVALMGGLAAWGLRSAAEARRLLYIGNMGLIQQAWEAKPRQFERVEALLDQTRDNENRGFEWGYWWNLSHAPHQLALKNKSGIQALAFSPNGRLLATGDDAGTARIWDAADGRLLQPVPVNRRGVVFVAFSRDGLRMTARGYDGTGGIWNAGTGRRLAEIPHPPYNHPSYAYACSPDGLRMIRGYEHGVLELSDAHGPLPVRVLHAFGRSQLLAGRKSAPGVTANPSNTRDTIRLTAFAPDGRRFLACAEDGTAWICDWASGRELLTLRGKAADPLAAAFSADGRRVAFASSSGEQLATVWDARTGKLLRKMAGGHSEATRCLAISPDGRYLATGGDASSRIWEIETGREILALHGHTSPTSTITFSPDGGRIATGSTSSWSEGKPGAQVHLWEFPERVKTRQWIPPPELRSSSGGAYSADGRRILLGTSAGDVSVWDLPTRRRLSRVHGHQGEVYQAACSRDGSVLATLDRDQNCIVWTAAGMRPSLRFRMPAHGVNEMALSFDGRRLAAASDEGRTFLWDLRTGCRRVFQDGPHEVDRLGWSPDGRRLATVSDKEVRIWDVASGRSIAAGEDSSREFGPGPSFSPDSSRLVVSRDDDAIVLDCATGRALLTLQGHAGDVLYSVFFANAPRIVTSGEDGTARVWDAVTGRELLALREPGMSLLVWGTSAGGRRLYGAAWGADDQNWTLVTWDAADPAEADARDAAARKRAGRP